MSDYPTISPAPPSAVNDFPPPYSAPASVVNDVPSGPITENVIHKSPPSYGFLNPLALNNTNNVGPSTIQPQPQFGGMESTPNMYGVTTMVHLELDQVDSYQVWSILNILFCCLCLGAIACFYSCETNDAKLRGDIQGALNASRNARTINIICTVLGLILNVILVIYYIGIF
jgi:hypothetical protein